MFCCTLLYVHFSIAIILMGKRELIALLKDNVIHNMAWWLKSAGALNFALSQEQCPISL